MAPRSFDRSLALSLFISQSLTYPFYLGHYIARTLVVFQIGFFPLVV